MVRTIFAKGRLHQGTIHHIPEDSIIVLPTGGNACPTSFGSGSRSCNDVNRELALVSAILITTLTSQGSLNRKIDKVLLRQEGLP